MDGHEVEKEEEVEVKMEGLIVGEKDDREEEVDDEEEDEVGALMAL